MRIVFFGSPEAAVPCLERLLACGHSVDLVITQPEKPSGRGLATSPSAVKRFAAAKGIPVLEPEKIRKDESLPDRLKAIGPDVNIVAAYGQIIPASILYLPPHKTLNVHFSLLPKYRGAAPVQWAVLNGETRTGVTIMELNEKMDEGDILLSTETAILPEETASALEERLADLGARLLIETLDSLDGIERVPQDHSLATYAPKLKKEEGRIDWHNPALVIERKVRAFTSRPGAFTIFRGKRLIILAGRLEEPRESAGPVKPPGTLLSWNKAGLTVACGDGDLYTIKKLQPEGKKAMPAHAFALGARLNQAESFDRS